ncbi:hypothetical protein YPPY04_1824, partial [Yersinia pestis PY-04]
MFITD